ncbi:Major cardiolipin synthase ClsA [Thermobacillus xylanilyticus]|jgi:cardiolipin synthase|uniref:Cardiolipin synthase n=1 Tax=Thermobacillus xylanilyticus TaxID=76633 RepID=A0ABN7RSI2_THEXY|nr:cardiolipin synthase [Thermobacillus xylanilyticus]CAG5085092.1 Major cardiolipin synthase ClsA [Thermobacillus xylanilyticus]
MTVLQNISMFLALFNLLFAATIVFLERRNVAATWAWILVLIFLPGLGFILYLILGQNLSRRRFYKIRAANRKRMERIVNRQREMFAESRIRFNDPRMEPYRDFMYMNLSSAHAIYSQDNAVDIFSDGEAKFDRLLADIEAAEDHVHLMYYIVRDDELGRLLMDKLVEKAAAGVEVRFLADYIGSHRLPRHFFRPLTEAGGQAAYFFPLKLGLLSPRLNYRNHRKLAIIDGRIGYIGGFNVGDEYRGRNPRFGYWRDTHLRVAGSAVQQMQARFLLDWNLAAPDRAVVAGERYFPEKNGPGRVGMQIVSSGPDQDQEQIKNGFIKMIHEAESFIYIQTPYFIPDDSFLTAIRIASLSGVDVRIMIPARPDHRTVYWATFAHLGDLLQSGVKVYLYGKGFLHAKTMVVDGKIATVGTANIDNRSFRLNFEVNAFLFDSETAGRLTALFEEDLKECVELTTGMYQDRPILHKARESVARLLSPIM